jgi:hypothetical protein
MALGRKDDVLWPDLAVEPAGGVEASEGGGDLADDAERVADGKSRRRIKEPAERDSFEIGQY